MDYERWNQAIISYFFEECEPGEIVFLQTNAETLFEIAELSNFNPVDPVENVESLKVAVRDKVVQSDRRVSLWSIDPTLRMNSQDKEPRHVTFLALMVLAASLMETTEGVFHTNYYTPLNQLLFDEPHKGKPQGIKLPQIEAFWKHLQKWASDYHNVELYLTQGSSNRRYVWYPISQCLINEHDRRTIYRFFSSNNLTPFSDLRDSELYDKLHYWTSSSQGSAKLNRYLLNRYYRKVIFNQVKSLLKL